MYDFIETTHHEMSSYMTTDEETTVLLYSYCAHLCRILATMEHTIIQWSGHISHVHPMKLYSSSLVCPRLCGHGTAPPVARGTGGRICQHPEVHRFCTCIEWSKARGLTLHWLWAEPAQALPLPANVRENCGPTTYCEYYVHATSAGGVVARHGRHLLP